MFQKIFAYAKQQGIEDIELYVHSKEDIEISLFQKDIDTYTVSSVKTIAARGLYQGKMGYASSEKVQDGVEVFLVDAIIANAKAITSLDAGIIYEGDANVVSLEKPIKLPLVAMADKIALLTSLHQKAKAYDERIVEVAHNRYIESNVHVQIINSKGVNLTRKQSVAYVYFSAVAKQGDVNKDGYALVFSDDFATFNADAIVAKACSKALGRLGASSIPSKEYKILLQNNVMTSLVQALISNVYAENVQKGYSALKDKKGSSIAASCFSLIEDPHNQDFLTAASFDDEGVATQYKRIIDQGVLTTYLYNLKTGLKEGIGSTGNGFKAGPTSLVGTNTTTLYVEKGEASFEQLLTQVQNGLMITSLQGIHAGLDPISGNFSLQAEGRLIENGALTRPVNLITVAGNLYELLQDIEVVGNDWDCGMSPGVFSPSIVIKKLAVSGE